MITFEKSQYSNPKFQTEPDYNQAGTSKYFGIWNLLFWNLGLELT
jgi:hypothetical protein